MLHFSKNSNTASENVPMKLILLICVTCTIIVILVVIIIVLLITRKKIPTQTNETVDDEQDYINPISDQDPDEPYGQLFLTVPREDAPIYETREPIYQNANAQALQQNIDDKPYEGIYVSQEEVQLNVMQYRAENAQTYDQLTFKKD